MFPHALHVHLTVAISGPARTSIHLVPTVCNVNTISYQTEMYSGLAESVLVVVCLPGQRLQDF